MKLFKTHPTENETNYQPKYFYWFAILLTFISYVVFIFKIETKETSNGIFILNYVLFITLVIGTMFTKGVRLLLYNDKKQSPYKPIYPILVMGLISCFGLNRELPIFFESCSWLTIVLIISCINILLLPYISKIPKPIQFISFSIIGISIVLFLYFSIVLLPISIIGAIGIIVLGIGIHAFIPMFILIMLIVVLANEWKRNQKNVMISLYTLFLVVLFVIGYVVKWQFTSSKINEIKLTQTLEKPSDLPEWVNIAKRIPKTSFTKKIILSDLLFVNSNNFWGDNFFRMPSGNFEEEKLHDPLVTLASLNTRKLNIAEEEKIKILESIFDARHLSENRLWTGKDLITQSVITDSRIFPKQRIAYTEKTLTIQNNSKQNWTNQEAIYTFYLPEGSTVSSLSLWINGNEEKGYLTTKQKADSAYKTIVGVENRDPSVVHWQEGNRVTVRVFPCTSKEARQFKIGITSPLKVKEGRLVYNDINFKGPNFDNANEIFRLTLMDKTTHLLVPKFLEKQTDNTFQATTNYKEDVEISFDNTEISGSKFSYNHKTYLLSEENDSLQTTPFDNIYVDINESWNYKDWTYLWNAIQQKNVFVFTDKIEKITSENQQNIFERLQQQHFSIFPIFDINDVEHSLLITKSECSSPNLNEIKGSEFYNKIDEFNNTHQKIKTILLGENISHYLKTLKEFRMLQLIESNLDETTSLIKQNKFPIDNENDKTVCISNAHINISEVPYEGDITNTAPDHLLRLFAYNTILKNQHTESTNSDNVKENIELSALANIVTPVSSLVVLESAEDYKRFDIQKNKDGLGNASMHNAGAVPEPHEWALIIVLFLAFLYLYNKQKLLKYVVIPKK